MEWLVVMVAVAVSLVAVIVMARRAARPGIELSEPAPADPHAKTLAQIEEGMGPRVHGG